MYDFVYNNFLLCWNLEVIFSVGKNCMDISANIIFFLRRIFCLSLTVTDGNHSLTFICIASIMHAHQLIWCHSFISIIFIITVSTIFRLDCVYASDLFTNLNIYCCAFQILESDENRMLTGFLWLTYFTQASLKLKTNMCRMNSCALNISLSGSVGVDILRMSQKSRHRQTH